MHYNIAKPACLCTVCQNQSGDNLCSAEKQLLLVQLKVFADTQDKSPTQR